MSAPIVSGAAAMLLSFHPGLTADRLSDALRQSADDLVDPWGDGLYLPGMTRSPVGGASTSDAPSPRSRRRPYISRLRAPMKLSPATWPCAWPLPAAMMVR